jgi:hypothetical protein
MPCIVEGLESHLTLRGHISGFVAAGDDVQPAKVAVSLDRPDLAARLASGERAVVRVTPE